MKKLLIILFVCLGWGCGDGKEVPVTVTSTTTTTLPQNTPPTITTTTLAPVIEIPKVPEYTCSKFIPGKDGSGGFVNNPDNSKGTLKIILPEKYTNKVVNVKVWTEDKKFKETLDRKIPNEYNDRQRYYGKKDIKDYPKNLIVGALLFDGTRVCVKVPVPQERLD